MYDLKYKIITALLLLKLTQRLLLTKCSRHKCWEIKEEERESESDEFDEDEPSASFFSNLDAKVSNIAEQTATKIYDFITAKFESEFKQEKWKLRSRGIGPDLPMHLDKVNDYGNI